MNSTEKSKEIAGEEIIEEKSPSSITTEVEANLDHQQTGIDAAEATTTGTAEDSTMESKEPNTIDESGTSVEANQLQLEEPQKLVMEEAVNVLSNKERERLSSIANSAKESINAKTVDEFLKDIQNFDAKQIFSPDTCFRICEMDIVTQMLALHFIEKRCKVLKISKALFYGILRDAKNHSKDYKSMPSTNKTAFEDFPEFDTGAYNVNQFGIHRDGKLISLTPIIPIKVIKNKDTKKVKVLVAIKTGGEWIRITISKRFLLSANLLTRLADTGLDVSAMNSRELVDYINTIFHLNSDKILVEDTYSSCGWNKDFTEFAPITNGAEVDDGDGENSIANFVHPQGDQVECLAFFKKMLKENMALRFIVAAALASIILKPLNLLPFFFHIYGLSGTGKTLGLMFAAALFGAPYTGGYLRILNGTINAQLHLAATLKNLPLILDELEAIRNLKGYRLIIMQMATGLDRNRLTSDFTQDQLKNWCCTFITNGESSLTRETDEAGVSNRVVELEVTKDFPVISNIEDGPKIVAFLNEHYGHIGPMFINVVRELIQSGELTDIFYRYFDDITNLYDTTTKMANNIAAILTADSILYQHIFNEDALDAKSVEALVTCSDSISPSVAAMELIINYANANSNSFNVFNEVNPDENRKATGVRLGTIRIAEHTCKIAILKTKLQAVLANAGYSFESVKHAWAESGFLIKRDGRHFDHQANIAGQGAYVIKLEYNLDEIDAEEK